MFATVTTVLIVASLLLGGGGATVFAAQGSLPDQALYPLKTWSEELRLDLTSNEAAKVDLNLKFANRRVEEVGALLEKGEQTPEAVLERLQTELDQALKAAAGMEDAQLIQTLERLRLNLQTQEKSLLHMHDPAGAADQAALERLRKMIQDRLRLVEEGLVDPQAFRNRMQRQAPGQEPPVYPRPEQEKEFGPGPFATGTPTPASGYGPGPGPNPSRTPGSGNGSGDGICEGDCETGPQGSHTPDPDTHEEEGYSPGPGPQANHTPESDGHDEGGYEFNPDPGNGDGVCDGDCENDFSGSGNNDGNDDSVSGNQGDENDDSDSGSDTGGNDDPDSGNDSGGSHDGDHDSGGGDGHGKHP